MGILLLGTIGQSVWRSEDEGIHWSRGKGSLFMESDIRALLPLKENRVLAGSETGVYESVDGGQTWRRQPGFPNGYQVWSLGSSAMPGVPDSPVAEEGTRSSWQERIWAGTCPAALFYSDDEGETWQEANARWLRTCAGGAIQVRLTTFLSDGQQCWAGAEIDGVQRSHDGGQTWKSSSAGLNSLDIHSLVRLPAVEGLEPALAAATNENLYLSTNEGLTWQPLEIGAHFQWSYCRGTAVDGEILLVGNGNGPPGSAGAIWSSPDRGKTWEQEMLPCPPNSTIWQILVTPGAVWAYSVLGQIFRRAPGGAWEKLPREFGEVRALCVLG